MSPLSAERRAAAASARSAVSIASSSISGREAGAGRLTWTLTPVELQNDTEAVRPEILMTGVSFRSGIDNPFKELAVRPRPIQGLRRHNPELSRYER